MNVSEYFNRGVDAQNHWLVLQHAHCFVGQSEDVLTAEGKVAIAIVLRRPLARAQQMRQGEIIEGILGVLATVIVLASLALLKQAW